MERLPPASRQDLLTIVSTEHFTPVDLNHTRHLPDETAPSRVVSETPKDGADVRLR
jgi:hypothetical protein